MQTPPLQQLPLAQIQPRGWLRQQLQIQADGLSGHLDLIWPDIADSAWIGGENDSWERVPYWLDGFIPLAYLLEDEDRKRRAKRYIDTILQRQQPDGWLCPCSQQDRPGYDLWALFLILKTLTVYQDASGDPRVEPAVAKALRQLDRHLDDHLLFGWAKMRWYESLISIYWLYQRHPQKWLLDLCVKLKSQGFDFPSLFERWPYQNPLPQGRWSQMNHVVNQAMMLKGWALYSLLSGKEDDRKAAQIMLSQLDAWHGQPNGLFSGDECLAGTSPVQGTELCAVVELMYSLSWLTATTGQACWGDRLEKVAFNALPATFSPDMWTHQYVQQANQIACTYQENPIFTTNGGDAHLFGLEPHFGCCTANLSQGWPKLTQAAVMRSRDPVGLALTVLLPIAVETTVNGQKVSLKVVTEYPFRNRVTLRIQASDPVAFAMQIRIPAWARKARLCDGKTPIACNPGTYACIDRVWGLENEVTLDLPMEGKWHAFPGDLIYQQRGPLVYALDIPTRWQQIKPVLPGHEAPHTDYSLHPDGPWAYGLMPGSDPSFQEKPVGSMPFSPTGAPVEATIAALPLRWPTHQGSAAARPNDREPVGAPENIRLIPYGCTNLRLTAFPLLRPPQSLRFSR